MTVYTPEQMCRAFLNLRDERSRMKKEFEERDNELQRKQDTIRSALLQHCRENDVESVRTAAGTFYRSVKTRYWTSDWEAMHRFVLEHEVPQFLDKRLNQTNVRQFLEENPDLIPPGLNADTTYTISVRKPK